MALDTNKNTTMAVSHHVKNQLDNLVIVTNGVLLRTPNDKLQYLLHEHEMTKKNT